jgi:hypothetical protein
MATISGHYSNPFDIVYKFTPSTFDDCFAVVVMGSLRGKGVSKSITYMHCNS